MCWSIMDTNDLYWLFFHSKCGLLIIDSCQWLIVVDYWVMRERMVDTSYSPGSYIVDKLTVIHPVNECQQCGF